MVMIDAQATNSATLIADPRLGIAAYSAYAILFRNHLIVLFSRDAIHMSQHMGPTLIRILSLPFPYVGVTTHRLQRELRAYAFSLSPGSIVTVMVWGLPISVQSRPRKVTDSSQSSVSTNWTSFPSMLLNSSTILCFVSIRHLLCKLRSGTLPLV